MKAPPLSIEWRFFLSYNLSMFTFEFMSKRSILIEYQYLGPVQYYASILAFEEILIEAKEHFTKGSYRNRCYLPGPNGVQILSIPLEKDKKKIVIDSCKIVYQEDWMKNHWQTIVSIYNRSAYFEYYKEQFEALYSKTYDTLFEFIEALNSLIFEILEVNPSIKKTTDYKSEYASDIKDYRLRINPRSKSHDEAYTPIEYYQTFQEKTGFLSEMSILDLIFCEGPNAIYLLQQAYSL